MDISLVLKLLHGLNIETIEDDENFDTNFTTLKPNDEPSLALVLSLLEELGVVGKENDDLLPSLFHFLKTAGYLIKEETKEFYSVEELLKIVHYLISEIQIMRMKIYDVSIFNFKKAKSLIETIENAIEAADVIYEGYEYSEYRKPSDKDLEEDDNNKLEVEDEADNLISSSSSLPSSSSSSPSSSSSSPSSSISTASKRDVLLLCEEITDLARRLSLGPYKELSEILFEVEGLSKKPIVKDVRNLDVFFHLVF
jgi:hypothetical protein